MSQNTMDYVSNLWLISCYFGIVSNLVKSKRTINPVYGNSKSSYLAKLTINALSSMKRIGVLMVPYLSYVT